ncbi:MAG: copper ion binding protein [Clostridia bacterium]|nr:copper ion binding protein [Clostridia bacterium]
MKTEILKVTGMSCSHCERAVNDAVGALSGVKEVRANAQTGTVTVSFDEERLSLEEIKDAISKEGYGI